MMKYLIITAAKVGTSILYEEIGCRGRIAKVPTYLAELNDDARPGWHYRFSVTRDAAPVVFGKETERFIDGGECPPNEWSNPYRGRLVNAPRNGTCLALYEPGLENRYSLRGMGPVAREHILIHAGPSSSLGCFSVSGDKEGWRSLESVLFGLLDPEEELVVYIEPRSQAHHDIHLSRSSG